MKKTLVLLTGLLLLSAACLLPGKAPEAAPTAAITVNPTLFPPTATPAGMPPALQSSLMPSVGNSTPVTEALGATEVKIFLISLGDTTAGNQIIGCDDSLIPVAVKVPLTQAVLREAYLQLLAIKGQHYGESGLYNSLYLSDLTLESVDLQDGKAVVHLAGSLVTNGMCDIPRIEAQLKSAAMQFSSVNEVTILVNGKPLEDVLSLK